MTKKKPQIPKYIVYDGQLLVGFNVDFHNELLPPDFDKGKVQGGGRVNVNENDKSIIFYGTSAEFDQCDKEVLKASLEPTMTLSYYVGYKVFWADYNKLTPEDAWAAAEEIGTVKPLE